VSVLLPVSFGGLRRPTIIIDFVWNSVHTGGLLVRVLIDGHSGRRIQYEGDLRQGRGRKGGMRGRWVLGGKGVLIRRWERQMCFWCNGVMCWYVGSIYRE
jgi:hypothetical protein